MPDWLARIAQEARALASAPFLSALALAVAIGAIWVVTDWSYRASLRSRDAHIAFLERRVSEYRDKLSGASPDEARQRIDALEAEVRTLRIQLQPRRLAPAQRQAIIDRSRPPAGAQPNPVTVVHEDPCSDCAQYGGELAAALQESGGWTVTTAIAASAAERSRTGLVVRVAEPLRPPPEAVVLQQALRSAGLAFDVVAGGSGQTVQLLIMERGAL